MMRSIFVCCVIFIAAVEGLKGPEPQLGRRAFTAAAAAILATNPQEAAVSTQPDPAAAYSFYGLVPPPIQGVWEYEELIERAELGEIATVQTAVSHDVVVATTSDGHRYACLVADKNMGELLFDSMIDGKLPFEVLPLDSTRAKVRDAAIGLVNLLGVFWVADLNGLLPWDTTPYGSIAQREEGRPIKFDPTLRKLLDQIRKPTARGAKQTEEASKDEALQRVLGLTKGDAAAELKGRLRAARPRQLEQQLIDAAGDLRASVDEMQVRLREAPWTTPNTLDHATVLPSLELLLTHAWRVSYDGTVEQLIRVFDTDRDTLVLVEDDEVWRLSPDFSAWYGTNNVYICKRLAVA